MKFIKQFASKSRITNVEATVVQKVSKAPSDKSGVIFCRALFLLLFWRSKKVNNNNIN